MKKFFFALLLPLILVNSVAKADLITSCFFRLDRSADLQYLGPARAEAQTRVNYAFTNYLYRHMHGWCRAQGGDSYQLVDIRTSCHDYPSGGMNWDLTRYYSVRVVCYRWATYMCHSNGTGSAPIPALP